MTNENSIGNSSRDDGGKTVVATCKLSETGIAEPADNNKAPIVVD
jgi:hypothetical protein